MTARPIAVIEWVNQIHSIVGNRWFLFSELPEELKNKSMLQKAACYGLLHKKRYHPDNDMKMWKVVL